MDTLRTVFDNLHLLVGGVQTTIVLAVLIVAIGTALGLGIGIGLLYGPAPLRVALRAYVDILRGTPLLVLMFLIFYGLPGAGVDIDNFWAVVAALSLFTGAHVGEIVRGAVNAVPRGQSDAAKALGLTFWPRLRDVILPQALPAALPPWTNTAIEMVKGTSLAYLLSVSDLLFETQNVVNRTGVPMPFYLTAALIYLLINLLLSRFGLWLERRARFAT
jgi:polar amino acid transport system permease protein